jgi:hypothetical protein
MSHVLLMMIFLSIGPHRSNSLFPCRCPRAAQASPSIDGTAEPLASRTVPLICDVEIACAQSIEQAKERQIARTILVLLKQALIKSLGDCITPSRNAPLGTAHIECLHLQGTRRLVCYTPLGQSCTALGRHPAAPPLGSALYPLMRRQQFLQGAELPN